VWIDGRCERPIVGSVNGGASSRPGGRHGAFLHMASHGDNIDLCISSAAKVRDTQ
jgi:hypothetical protein